MPTRTSCPSSTVNATTETPSARSSGRETHDFPLWHAATARVIDISPSAGHPRAAARRRRRSTLRSTSPDAHGRSGRLPATSFLRQTPIMRSRVAHREVLQAIISRRRLSLATVTSSPAWRAAPSASTRHISPSSAPPVAAQCRCGERVVPRARARPGSGWRQQCDLTPVAQQYLGSGLRRSWQRHGASKCCRRRPEAGRAREEARPKHGAGSTTARRVRLAMQGADHHSSPTPSTAARLGGSKGDAEDPSTATRTASGSAPRSSTTCPWTPRRTTRRSSAPCLIDHPR